AMLQTLKPRGRMHVVGAVVEPMGIPAFSLIGGQKSVLGSPTGSPAMIATMLEFAARHKISPQVEHFPLSKVNDALAHLRAGKARYRIVLDGGK
ncbi:MAG TPA: zinc-binding dehydrogenase, partial [Pirellulales bacterium]